MRAGLALFIGLDSITWRNVRSIFLQIYKIKNPALLGNAGFLTEK